MRHSCPTPRSTELDSECGRQRFGLSVRAAVRPGSPADARRAGAAHAERHAPERLECLGGVSLPVESSCNGVSFNNFMLVTHRGLSGPSLLQISSYWQPGDALRLDLLPTLDAEAFLREQRQSRPARKSVV